MQKDVKQEAKKGGEIEDIIKNYNKNTEDKIVIPSLMKE